MSDPSDKQFAATHIVLHSWVSFYLSGRANLARPASGALASQLEVQAEKLRESAANLTAAIEKMRAANAKLAARMAEHKAFFDKYQRPQ